MLRPARTAMMLKFPSTKVSKNQLGRTKSTWLALKETQERHFHVFSINMELMNTWN